MLSSDFVVSGPLFEYTKATTVGPTCGVTYGAPISAGASPTYTTQTSGC